MTIAQTKYFSGSQVYIHARKKTGTAGERSVYSDGRNQDYELWLQHVKAMKYKPETGEGSLTLSYLNSEL
jgi:glutamate formiminotransferase